ncbi:MAG TPA: class I SAM-dependent methyltransferase [Aggregatilineaceae bacterium]|nr:class I SAM-dependent methyltransferase [Aggregatilineaceae bacterium]
MNDVIKFFNAHKPKSSPGNVELALEQTTAGAGATVIDVCCGSGGLTSMAAGRGFKAYGVDISTRYIGTSSSGGAAFVVGDMMAIPFPAGCASVVYCVDSLQYATDVEGALAEMGRLLRPGGLLIFSTQNTYNLAGVKKYILEKLTGRVWSPWLAHPIEHAVTYPWLIQALERQGFAVEYVRGRQHLIAWVSLLPSFVRRCSPWPGKPWRSLQGLAQRTSLPARFEESTLSRFAMILLIRARKK